MNKKILIISVITLIIDQLLKGVIETSLKLNEAIVIIKDFFYFRYTNNTGAAWSILSDYTYLLIACSIIALIIIYRYMNTFKDNERNRIAFGLLYGGITGNLIDRLFLGYVRDFLDFRILGYDFPIFNISDMAIFFGVILLIYAVLKGEDDENNRKRKSR